MAFIPALLIVRRLPKGVMASTIVPSTSPVPTSGPNENTTSVVMGLHGIRVTTTRGLMGSRTVRRIFLFGLFMSSGAGGIIAFLPLYLQDRFGVDPGHAGMMLIVFALPGAVMSVALPRIMARAKQKRRVLIAISVSACTSAALLYVSTGDSGWAVWPATVLFGLAAAPWVGVGMYLIVEAVSANLSGRASGALMLAVSTGPALSPLLMGYLAETSQSYASAWLAVLVIFLGALVVVASWPRHLIPGARIGDTM